MLMIRIYHDTRWWWAYNKTKARTKQKCKCLFYLIHDMTVSVFKVMITWWRCTCSLSEYPDHYTTPYYSYHKAASNIKWFKQTYILRFLIGMNERNNSNAFAFQREYIIQSLTHHLWGQFNYILSYNEI